MVVFLFPINVKLTATMEIVQNAILVIELLKENVKPTTYFANNTIKTALVLYVTMDLYSIKAIAPH